MSHSFNANLTDLYEMLDLVRKNVETTGFDSVLGAKIELAVEEALVNVINYAYPSKDGVVEIEFEVNCSNPDSKPGLSVVLRDTGIPFDPLQYVSVKDANLEPSVGGYGVFFIKNLMDEVHYDRVDGQNILKMVKYLP